jgi:GNAT superfamily N-acetyltransferase
MPTEEPIRRAGVKDAAEIARMLHDFNTEFSDPTPGVEYLAGRIHALLAEGAIVVLLGGEPPVGLAQLRFRPSVWSETLDAYLEELYVKPPRRGGGIGRALLEAAMDLARGAGAVHIDLGTGEADTAARALYESCGFTNLEGAGEGTRMLFYERDL